MRNIPSDYNDLLADESRALAYLATTMPDGTPQVTPVWFNDDGEHILINSAVGRVKDRNMRARPEVALVIADPKDPYRYIQIRGRVVNITTDGADDHIDTLAGKYTGIPHFAGRGMNQQRVTYTILPEHIDVHR